MSRAEVLRWVRWARQRGWVLQRRVSLPGRPGPWRWAHPSGMALGDHETQAEAVTVLCRFLDVDAVSPILDSYADLERRIEETQERVAMLRGLRADVLGEAVTIVGVRELARRLDVSETTVRRHLSYGAGGVS